MLDNAGNTNYFIVHTDRSLSAFADLNQDDEEVAHLVESVSKRQLIPFFGEGKEAWQQSESEWPACFYQPEILVGKEKYYWTVIREGK